MGMTGQPIGSMGKPGYVRVAVRLENKFASIFAHRVIWEFMHGPIPPPFEINHINGIKCDNRTVNLELLTPSENIKHAFRMGLIVSPSRAHVKFSDETVQMVHDLREQGRMYKDIAEITGMSIGHAKSIGCGMRRKRPLTSIGLATVEPPSSKTRPEDSGSSGNAPPQLR